MTAPDTLADDLGLLGAWVGPRSGPDKRDHGQKEDYVLRRLLVAWRDSRAVEFPIHVRAERQRPGEPDFLLALPDGFSLGVDVTEAGEEDYQAWLTHIERETEADSDTAVMLPGDGSVGGGTKNIADLILVRVREKVEAYDKGSYRTPDACDLVVYDNTAWGGFLERRDVLRHLGRHNDLIGRFRQIHLVFANTVVLDAFGSSPQSVDVSRTYEIDYAKWVADQVDRIRERRDERFDWEHVAEELESLGRSERRALRSHLETLIVHLLKWRDQPERRGKSWELSIRNARGELYELLREQPSLKVVLADAIADAYRKGRRVAAQQIDASEEMFPERCPYSDREILDPEFLPGEPG